MVESIVNGRQCIRQLLASVLLTPVISTNDMLFFSSSACTSERMSVGRCLLRKVNASLILTCVVNASQGNAWSLHPEAKSLLFPVRHRHIVRIPLLCHRHQ